MGYAPLFDSLTKGTLCGRWPDIGLWPVILSLSDPSGVVDATPNFISSVTGLALAEVIACMHRFCQPDPYSRSTPNDGARLSLLDTHRDWGWKIVNHAYYREKARLAAKAAREVETGVNADRMKDRRGPPPTAADPLSNSYTNSDKERERAHAPKVKTASKRVPEEFVVTAELRASVAGELPKDFDIDRETAKFRDCEFPRAHTDWDATWRKWMRSARDKRDYAKTGVGGARWL